MSSTVSGPRNENADILAELKKISIILAFANSQVIEDAIGKIAKGETRKKMWIFIDGKRIPTNLL